jgi:hypothetical protein
MTESKNQQPRENYETGGVGQAKGVANQVAGQAKDVANQVAGQAKDIVRSRLSTQTSRSAIQLGELANALRQTGEQLEGNVASPFVSKAADRLDRVSELLDSADPTELVRSVEQFARREPLLFLGGAFALGIVGARFLKSSATHAQSAMMGGASGETTGVTATTGTAGSSGASIGGSGMDFRP